MLKKTCSVCKIEKEASLFYPQKDGKFGLTSRCKTCVLRSNKKWELANKEKRKQIEKRRLQNPENKQKALEATRRWRRNNLEYDAERQRQRKARFLQAVPKWYPQEKDKIKKVYEKAKELGFTVDHIVPLKSDLVCGLHTWANLQLLESSLNSRKRNLEWPDA